MNKKKKLILVIILFFLSLIVGFLILYFKPIKLTVNITENTKSNITLKRKLNKCYVISEIKKNDKDVILFNLLKDDGYKKDKNVYIKSKTIYENCNSLYKKYKKDNTIFKLNGSDNINIEFGDIYTDDGYILKNNNLSVKSIEKLDLSKLGKQYMIYKLEDIIFDRYLIRNINIIDSKKPEIKLNGNSKKTVYLNNKYVEEGYTAIDNYDGDITNKVEVIGNVDTSKVGEYEIRYKVSDSSNNETLEIRKVIVKEKPVSKLSNLSVSSSVDGLTYINGILIVNKKYGLPSNYNPGVNPEANSALKKMQADASAIGLNLKLVSGFRSYEVQYNLYNNYVRINGKTKADTFSAMPGHSEHQTGLAFDIGSTKGSFARTSESKWLEENAHLYGFIIRYPKGKTSITGYIYEPWHVRYLGVDIATDVKNSGLCLEEYLGIN